MDISNIIKKRRKELGLTLLDIAKTLGVSESTVQRWETGNIKTIKYEHIISLSDMLQVEPAAMMGLTPINDTIVPAEEKLLDIYRSLNAEGCDKLLSYADDLVSSGKYIKSGSDRLVEEA